METIRELLDPAKPIDRRIEKVINYETTADDLLRREIGEYVATDSIEEHLERLLTRFDEGMGDGSREVGVWVSGFYGSGKSSFTKYLGFSFDADRKIDGQPFSELLAARLTSNPLRQQLRTATAKHPTTVIMLDLASEQLAGAQMHDIATVLYNKVVQWAGYSRDAKIADLELMLERDGKLDAFKARVAEIGKGRKWDSVKDQGLVANTWAARLAPEFYPDIWPDSASFKNVSVDLRIKEDDRVREMLQLIRRRSGRENIIFVIDEVGQYIASRDELILKLQGLAEIIKNTGGGKVWILATAQQTLTEDDPRARFNSAKLFKLKDRFPLSVDIEATDIQEICYRRLLAKSPAGRKRVEAMFDASGEALRHATSLTNTRYYKSDFDKERFQQLYPFLPHHFEILMELLAQLARSSGGIGLRSAIKIIQDVLVDRSALRPGASLLADQPAGTLATSVVFYDVLHRDIERGYRHVVQAVGKIASGYGEDSTEHQVAKSIAVLQVLDDFPLTRENVAALMYPAVAAAPVTTQVKQAVDNLLKDPGVPINELDGKLRFMSEAMAELEKERQSIIPRTAEVARLVNECIQKVFEPLPQARLENTLTVHSGVSVMVGGIRRPLSGDKSPIQTVVELVASTEYPSCRKARIQDSTLPANSSVISLLGHDSPEIPALAEETYRSLEIYRRHRNQTGEKELGDYLEGQRQRAEALAAELGAKVAGALKAGTFIFRGRPTPATELDGTSVLKAASAELQAVAVEVFCKYTEAPVQADAALAERFLKTENLPAIPSKNDPLKLVKGGGGTPIHTAHPAIVSVHDYLDRNGTVEGRKLLDDFFAAPYGWSKDTTRYVVAAMLTAGDIKLRISGEDVMVRGAAAVEGLRNNNSFNKIGVGLRGGGPSPEAMLRATERLLRLTGEPVDPLEDEISRAVRRCFPDLQQSHAGLPTQLRNLDLPGVDRAESVQDGLAEILKGDASDATSRLGGEECALFESLVWARDVRKAFGNGLDTVVRDVRANLAGMANLPKIGTTGTLVTETEETRNKLAGLLGREDFYRSAPDLQTGHQELAARIGTACQQLQIELRAEIAQRRDALQSLPEWGRMGPESQRQLANQIGELGISVAPGFAGIQKVLNYRYELDSALERIRQDILVRGKPDEVADGEEGATIIDVRIPELLRDGASVDAAVQLLADAKAQLGDKTSIHLILQPQKY